MKTYNLEKSNRKKKHDRMMARQNLDPHYAIVERVPEEGKKVYTKLVTIGQAIKLLRGRLVIGLNGVPNFIKLSREFRLA